MSKNNLLSIPVEVSRFPELSAPTFTRGLRREQAKRERRRLLVGGRTLIVGLDLAREHQAVSFAEGNEIVGRLRPDCPPQLLAGLLPRAEKIRQSRQLDRILFAFEPAGHYWCLAAEGLERAGVPYVLVHGLSVKREREGTRFNPERSDPRDADLVAMLTAQGKITETQLPETHERAALADLARDYFLARKASAAESARLHNFWNRLLPEFYDVVKDPTGSTALAVSRALLPLSELASLSPARWRTRVKKASFGQRILPRRAVEILALLQAAHLDPHRRSGEGMPARIRHAAERRTLLEQQKDELRREILERYQACEESLYLDSIPGSDPLYNALVLALVGDFRHYDDPRAIVKLAGSEVNHFSSGDFSGTSRISHRGRSPIRAAAYQQARNLVQRNEDFRSRYSALFRRSSRPLTELQAYVAVMNSYLRTAHVLVTQKTFYRSRAERGEP
jgi:transposase